METLIAANIIMFRFLLKTFGYREMWKVF